MRQDNRACAGSGHGAHRDAMHVLGHWLVGDGSRCVARKRTPNLGGLLHPRYVVLHYTALDDAAQAIAHLTSAQTRVSAHVLVARSGEVTQLAPFDRVAWHAGASRWGALHDLNRYAIGVELDNPGWLIADGRGYRTTSGQRVHRRRVMMAEHAWSGEPTPWHRYSRRQLESLRALCVALCRSYGIESILGHDQIAPQRKCDPGPAFPRKWLTDALTPFTMQV
jgi:N-acetylmuramoyl-L-alanine amidase